MCHFAQDFVFSSSLSPSPILLSKGAAFHHCWLFWSRMYIYFILWFLTNTRYLFCWIQYLSKTSIIHRNPPAMFKHIGMANIHKKSGKTREPLHLTYYIRPVSKSKQFTFQDFSCYPYWGWGLEFIPLSINPDFQRCTWTLQFVFFGVQGS